jgi:signal transduction histidine kinase
MTSELPQFRIKDEPDIIYLHETALHIGAWAGLSITERIRFAANVVENSLSANSEPIEVSFVVTMKDNRCYLRASMNNPTRQVEREIAQRISSIPVSPFQISPAPLKKLQEDNKDMQQFTFALAHDLKNSLTKLKLALSLLEDEEIPPAIDGYIRIMHRAAERLETITLGLNKVIQLGNKSPDVIRKISPAIAFTEVQEEFTESLNKAGATIEKDFGIETFNYIEVYLKSIFSNLLNNSIKYSTPSRPLRLSVSANWQDGKAVFTFSDNGHGIDLNAHGDKLFHPFTRFSNNPEGSGIGLYLIKNIIERNGGKIEVVSTPGEGTEFRFLLAEYDLSSSSPTRH